MNELEEIKQEAVNNRQKNIKKLFKYFERTVKITRKVGELATTMCIMDDKVGDSSDTIGWYKTVLNGGNNYYDNIFHLLCNLDKKIKDPEIHDALMKW